MNPLVNCALASVVGVIQICLVNYQVRQVSAGKTGWPLFFVAVGISSVWGVGVMLVSHTWMSIPFYAVSAGVGAALSTRFKVKA